MHTRIRHRPFPVGLFAVWGKKIRAHDQVLTRKRNHSYFLHFGEKILSHPGWQSLCRRSLRDALSEPDYTAKNFMNAYKQWSKMLYHNCKADLKPFSNVKCIISSQLCGFGYSECCRWKWQTIETRRRRFLSAPFDTRNTFAIGCASSEESLAYANKHKYAVKTDF